MPHLGRWKARDVIAHLGGVHRWATRIVASASMDGPGFRKSKLDGEELLDWFDEGVEHLVAELGQHDPDDPCPNFNPGSPGVVRFWYARQLHETSIHRWDVESAFGDPEPIHRNTAAHGIAEYLDVFIRTRGKQTLTGPLRVTSTDVERSFLLTPAAKPGRIDIEFGGTRATEAEIAGRASDVLLHLWGRRSFDDAEVTVTGDAVVARSLTEPV